MHHLEPPVEQAVRQFFTLISDRYDIEQIIIYGSHARGDHRPDSDVDVAVLLRGAPQRCLPVKWKMSEAAYDILLETGIVISPMPIWLDEWSSPENYSNPSFLENIDKERIRLP